MLNTQSGADSLSCFQNKTGEAFFEEVPLSEIAEKTGTPVYVYSQSSMETQCRRLKEAFSSYPTVFCYAVKANSNLSILKSIFKEGFGAEAVSGGELLRALKAGVDTPRA